MERKTKLIVSLGPSISDTQTVREAIKSGMDVARLNLTHNSREWHSEMIGRVRKEAASMGRSIPIIIDITGPSVRTGDLDTVGFLEIRKGQELTLTVEHCPGGDKVHVPCPELVAMVDQGSTIYIDDASVQLEVTHKSGQDIMCRSLNDSRLGSRRTVHIPGKSFELPLMSDRDWVNMEFGIEKGAEYFGISFVRSGKDLRNVREFLRERGSGAKLIAKIETPEALENLESIIEEADMVMIARGDLGVILPLEEVPVHQYRIISECRRAGKPVATATEMLNSMKKSPRPTRAEVNDVFTAVACGSDYVMLSGETAEGDFPIESIEYMDRIARKAEKNKGCLAR